MRVFFTNLGCKLNQAEVEALTRRFTAAGHALASGIDDADLHVINSCTVTHLAARDSRKLARRGRRRNPALKTVMTGCFATASPEEAAAVAGVDLVVTNDAKHDLVSRVHDAFPDTAPRSPATSVPCLPFELGRARALVKVEDGCNMSCSFCIIPSTRGRQRSRRLEEVIGEVRRLVADGFPEIVITGVQISEYDDRGRRLYDLVRAILGETGVPRLRLTSIAPWKFDHRLLGLWRDRRLCRHLHMSLQSGSTVTLRRMRRAYSAERYAALVDEVRSAIPGVAITTDVIVGFPGETPGEFDDSLEFVARMGFAKPHVFTYSSRPGTHAATLADPVAPAEKKARVARMLAVARESERGFYRRHLGETLDVVWEEKKRGRWNGLTDNYIRVFADSPSRLAGTIGRARLEGLVAGGVSAALVASSASATSNLPVLT